MKKTNINWKQVGTVAVGAVLVGATLGALALPREVPVEVRVPYEVVKTEYVDVEVPVPYEVEKIVEKEVFVDNGDMAFVLQRLEDKAIIADAEEIVAELKAEDKALADALAFVAKEKVELFDMLEKEGIVANDRKVKIIKTYSDYEDVTFNVADFDAKEYELEIRYKIEDTEDDVKKYIRAVVSIEDGDFELVSVFEE